MSNTNLPLHGIKVLDLTRLLPGPYCTQYLADLGCEVLRIESPIPDLVRYTPPFVHDRGTFDLSVNRNKKSLMLNLKSEKGKLIFFQLIEKFDVVIEQFRPGIVDKLGISYESVKMIKEDIIYCSISGYGQNGPYKNKPGHDINYLSEAGLLHDQVINNKTGTPFQLPQIPIADISGSFSAIIGILSAVIQKNNTGKGQYIDISMFDSIFSWLNMSLLSLGLINSNLPVNDSKNNVLSGKNPYYTTYQTKDDPISIGALEPHFWENLCKKLGKPEFIADQFNESMYETMRNSLQDIFLQKTQKEWVHDLQDMCIAPVLTIDQTIKNEQLKQRNSFIDIPIEGKNSYIGINNPIKFAEEIKKRPPPKEGESTVEVLISLGYTMEDINQLRTEGII